MIRFTDDDARKAGEAWGFNCGPGALCAVLGKTPDELRPHLLDFEQKGYTNPSLMRQILRGLHVSHHQVYHREAPHEAPVYPKYGLVRVQWAGPWTQPGVPMAARYRATHWVAVRDALPGEACGGRMVFDVNAVANGWLTFHVWRTELVPWLIKVAVPKASGEWWPTHSLEVER